MLATNIARTRTVTLSFGAAAILHAVAAGQQFGFDIIGATGLTSGTVYPTLSRAERAGFVRGKWEDRQVADREARPRRRHYVITAAGEAALTRSVERLDTLTAAARAAVRKVRA